MEHPLFTTLPQSEQTYLMDLHAQYCFSFQEQRQIIETASDLRQWKMGPIERWFDEQQVSTLEGRKRTKALVGALLKLVNEERRRPTDYTDFFPSEQLPEKIQSVIVHTEKILGRCPCPVEGEKTRCCNLRTLDAVQQCAFGCSYCSIQSFYNKGAIEVVGNLQERLEQITLEEDFWHIGTGQSSDSLLWGNDFGTLDALATLARRYPKTIIELKTKSHRTDWIAMEMPPNIVATWSLNAPTIIEKEEHLSATLEQRIAAARKAADKGIPVGFHLHPMVWFKGWQEEYASVIDTVVDTFASDELVMFSLGTLTFTKAVLRTLRGEGRESRILDMELTGAAGKYSYPLATKQEMFSHAYSCFPKEWREEGPFFYLCMEDPSLWEPTFGYGYPDDRSFEAAMKESYQKRVALVAKKEHLSKESMPMSSCFPVIE
ncbi:MAG: DNA photolyase [Sphaerochaeta sp.]|nr:DNA photolyase [Sphaerochaeta sp.]